MKKILVFSAVILVVSCTRELDLNFANEQNKIVIEANLSNLEPIYVRLTNSTNEQIVPGSFDDPTDTGIDNAKVTIVDNLGNSQQLKKYFFRNKFTGYYNSLNYVGLAGRTYTIEVEIEGKKFMANSKMPEVTELDSVSIKFKTAEPGKSDKYLPQIYFKDDSNAVNYYLTKFCPYDNRDMIPIKDQGLNCQSFGRAWNFSIIEDRFLKNYVNGLDINVGESPGNFVGDLSFNAFYQARLYQINKETYDHYKDLINQIKSDGGAYKPSPTSAKGNISGGALGFFAAMSVSVREFKVTKK